MFVRDGLLNYLTDFSYFFLNICFIPTWEIGQFLFQLMVVIFIK